MFEKITALLSSSEENINSALSLFSFIEIPPELKEALKGTIYNPSADTFVYSDYFNAVPENTRYKVAFTLLSFLEEMRHPLLSIQQQRFPHCQDIPLPYVEDLEILLDPADIDELPHLFLQLDHLKTLRLRFPYREEEKMNTVLTRGIKFIPHISQNNERAKAKIMA